MIWEIFWPGDICFQRLERVLVIIIAEEHFIVLKIAQAFGEDLFSGKFCPKSLEIVLLSKVLHVV